MTRRDFFQLAAATGAASSAAVAVPLNLILDSRAKFWPPALHAFWSRIWPQAVRDFARGGIELRIRRSTGGIDRPPYREPVLSGLDAAALNVIITDQIPMSWDLGRALNGVATRYRGYHVCVIALARAHGHLVPFLSVNTCVHELLHVLVGDVLSDRPAGWRGHLRESRVDAYATRLWLFGDGAAIRDAARIYVEKLRAAKPQ